MLYLLIEYLLDTFSHSRDSMVRTVEGHAVAEDETNVCDKLIGISVPRVLWVRVWFRGIRRNKLAIDGGEIHGTLYDTGIVWDVQSDRVNGLKKRYSVFQLF